MDFGEAGRGREDLSLVEGDGVTFLGDDCEVVEAEGNCFDDLRGANSM